MKTVRRLLFREITASVFFVALAFLSLFGFIDVVDELEGVGRNGRTLGDAFLAAALELPAHLYDLVPVAVLIGSIYALSRMAQTSEFTILRTGGLGPGRALSLLAQLGLGFALLTWFTGDVLAPMAERQGLLLKARHNSGIRIGGAGAWLKEKRMAEDGEHSVSINVAAASGKGELMGVRIFDMDASGRLATRVEARQATVGDDGHWVLQDATVTRWPLAAANAPLPSAMNASSDTEPPPLGLTRHATLRWPSTLAANVVSAAVLPLGSMTTWELWRYSSHLSVQEQAAQEYAIRFWRKALYPFACFVMLALALPFAYLHARAGGISVKVFGGILLGISFVLLNNLSGFVGLLQGLSPWLAAAIPSLVYLLLSMGAFTWLVRYR